MAKCKRCGTVFNYNKSEGVCPQCRFYNRPEGAPDYNNEWFSSYNVEENTYELPKSITDTTGTAKEGKNRSWIGRSKIKNYLIPCAIILVILVPAFFVFIGLDGVMVGTMTSYSVETMSRKKLEKGARIGDLTFSSDCQARVLFDEGEVEWMPKGEKCIGIRISDNETILEEHSILWQRPYVFDGSSYRDMLDHYNTNVLKTFGLPDVNFMTEYLSKREDFDGIAAYFIDKDADTVTLCIPGQRMEGRMVLCSSVTEIKLPVIEKGKGGD